MEVGSARAPVMAYVRLVSEAAAKPRVLELTYVMADGGRGLSTHHRT
jgi:hypothetical protein